jgi:hypothetical protein
LRWITIKFGFNSGENLLNPYRQWFPFQSQIEEFDTFVAKRKAAVKICSTNKRFNNISED